MGRPVGFLGNAGSAECAESSGMCAIYGAILGGLRHFPNANFTSFYHVSAYGGVALPGRHFRVIAAGDGTYLWEILEGVRPYIRMSPRRIYEEWGSSEIAHDQGWPVSRRGYGFGKMPKSRKVTAPCGRSGTSHISRRSAGEHRRHDSRGPLLSGNMIKSGKSPLPKFQNPHNDFPPKMAKIPEVSAISAFRRIHPGFPVDVGIDGHAPSRSCHK